MKPLQHAPHPVPAPFRFSCITLGCKVNQYETHALREAWLAAGHVEALDIADAEYIFVNSCAVTAKAVADVRSAVHRANRAAPQAAIVVTGCAAQVMRDDLASLPGVVLVTPQSEKALLREFTPSNNMPRAKKNAQSAFPPFSISSYDRSRAVLKVQDGCSHRCAYCIVPLARGPSRSRPPREAAAEAHRLLEAGFRELIVNGVNLSQYGGDIRPPLDFWDLLHFLERELAPEWHGEARLRLSSLEPGQLTQKALDTLSASRLVAPHIHLSLQSGSPVILRRMGRGHCSPALLEVFFRQLHSIWPLFGLGADILTGFPGETEENAMETKDLCAALPFTYGHVFPYSPRPGTAAAAWPDQISGAVRKKRAAELRDLFSRKQHEFLVHSLSLPRVHVAREGGASAGGINEYYSDCVFTARPAGFAHRSLTPARPVGISPGGKLEVTARQGNGDTEDYAAADTCEARLNGISSSSANVSWDASH